MQAVAAQQTPPLATPVCPGPARQRDPPVFSGTEDQDVEDWLSSYEKVSGPNRWDDATKLGTVNFYLGGVAKLWYTNHELEFQSWSAFKEAITAVFGRPAVRKLRAEQRLRTRAQEPNETFTAYIEAIIDLCRRVDASMSESVRIQHILKGVDDDVFQMLLAKSPGTVSEVVTLCQSYDELRRQRALTRRSPSSNQPLAALDVVPDHAYLAQMKDFVREEVARQLSLLPFAQRQELPQQPPLQQQIPLAPVLRHVVQEQIAEAMPAPIQQHPVAAPLTYAEAVQRQQLQQQQPLPFQGVSQVSHVTAPTQAPVAWTAPIAANPWRTRNNRPICFACRGVGHVARYCHRLAPGYTDARSQYNYVDRPRPRYESPDPQSTTSSRDYPQSGSRRSPSPRRRSLSPVRRTSP